MLLKGTVIPKLSYLILRSVTIGFSQDDGEQLKFTDSEAVAGNDRKSSN